ncbi:MAG: hypothetical protein IID15_05725 [Candidatus Marinimicrobia bacterium]|nr:hypothetical protein [Candidatus Neomarinimicrobiota bacterium]
MVSASVTIGNYLHRYEAEIALGLLRSCGMECWILADDAGGMQPQLNFAMKGVRLMTTVEQAEEARAVLEAKVEQGTDL